MLGGVILTMNKMKSLPCQESFKLTSLGSNKFPNLTYPTAEMEGGDQT